MKNFILLHVSRSIEAPARPPSVWKRLHIDVVGSWLGLTRASNRVKAAFPGQTVTSYVGPLLVFVMVTLLGALFLI